MRFSDDEMWQAVVNCDESYDGQLFYAVKTVGVFCRPSCKSRTSSNT
ncbi:Ada metal-binding domain-containing protein [Desulfosporosinus sp. SB140]